MFAPRPLSYQLPPVAPPPRAPSSRNDEKSAVRLEKKNAAKQMEGWRGFGWRPESFHKTQAQRVPSAPTTTTTAKNGGAATSPTKLRRDISSWEIEEPEIQQVENPTDHENAQNTPRSTPMAVPSRPGMTRPAARPGVTETRQQTSRSQPRSERLKKDPRLPASVTSILESTSIPKKTSFPQPRSSPSQTLRRMSTQQLMDEWKRDEDLSGSSLSGSPNLDLLLSPPQEESYLSRNESSESFHAFSRSASSDSVPSIQFLEADESSELSWSLPTIPSPNAQRRTKSKLHPPRQQLTEELDHPLSPPTADDMDDYLFPASKADASSVSSAESSQSATFRPALQSRKPSSFKSNLTASLNNLRSSIRTSLSNFSAPSPYVLPEDHLSRGFFGPSLMPIRSEMRPRPFDGPPTPGLRRYMNPSSYHVPSPAHDFHLHGHGRVIEHLDLEAAAAATAPGAADQPVPTFMDRSSIIPLQTYHPSRTSNSKALPVIRASNDPDQRPMALTEAGRALGVDDDESHKPQYRRELRENGEFLRVCILEMNMRRAGKLADGPGRARLWLPPRVDGESESREEESGGSAQGKKIPRRWIGVNVSP